MKNDIVRIQKQIGPTPLKWDKTGKVVEVHQHDQYVIKVNGSGRVTVRNRKFLRKFSPFTPTTTGTQIPSRLPLRGSTKIEGQKDTLVSEERNVSDTTSAPPAAPEKQLESPLADTEAAEPDHSMVDTRDAPSHNPQTDVPNRSFEPPEEPPTAPRRSTRMRKPTDKFNMTQLGGGKR